MSSFKDRFRQKAPAASPRTQISQPSTNTSSQPPDPTTTNVAQLMPTSICSPPRPSSVITSTTSPPSGGHQQQQPSAALLQVLSAQTSPLRTPSSINLEMQKTPLDLSSSDLQHLPQPGAPHASSTISQNIFGAVSPPQQNNSATTIPIPTAPSNIGVKALYLPASVQHHHHGVGGQEPSLNSPHLMIHTSSTLSSLASMGDLTRQGSTTLTGGITTPVRGARVNALLEHAEQQAAHRGGGGGSLNTPKRSAHYSIAGNSRGKESPAPAPAIPSPTHASPHGRLDDGHDVPVNAQQQQNRTVGNASPASFSGRKVSSFSSVALHSFTGRSGSRTRLIGQQQLSSDQLHSPGQALARKFESASPATPVQDQVLPRTGTKPGASASSYRSLLPEEGSPVSTLLGPLHNQSYHQATGASSATRHNTAISTFARNLADELQVATAMSSASSYPVVQGNYSSTNTTCLGGARNAHGVVGTPSPRSALAVPDGHAAAASYNNSNGNNPLLLHVPRPGSADSSCLTTGRIESTIRDIIGDATLRRVTDFEVSEQQRRIHNNNLVAGKSPALGGSDEDDSGEDRLGSTQQIIENDSFIALESTSEVVFLGTALADALRASGSSGSSSRRGFVAAEASEAIRIVNYDDEVGKYVGGPCIGGDDDINIGNCNCSDNDIQQFFPGFDLRKYKAAEVFHHCVECHRRPASFLCLNCFQAVCPSHVHTHFHKGTIASTAATLAQKPNTNSLCFLYLNMLDVEHSFDRQLWCERCQRFTWKCADTYEPLVEQLLYSKGSYLPGDPITDVHIVAYKSSDPIQSAAAVTAPPGLTSQSLIGELLSSPTLEPQPENHLSSVPVGGSALLPRRQWTALAGTVQGWRASQEDAEAVFQLEFPRHLLGDGHTGAPPADSSPYVVLHCFAVFDGHGGDAVAELVAAGLPRHLQSLVDARYGSTGASLGDPASEHAKKLFASPGAHGGEQQQQRPDHLLRSAICDIMEDGFMSFDEGLRNSKEGRQGDFNCVGCTATVVGAYSQQSSGGGDPQRWTLVTANLGDSGAAAIVLRPALDGECVEPVAALSMITTAHRIDGAEEARRIKAAGYSIQGGRIEGLLAVPRAFGDFDFKQCGGDREARDQAVTSCPEVKFFGEEDDTFGEKQTLVGLVVGCDGLWDSHKHPERDIARLLFKPTPSVQQQATIQTAKVQHPQRLLTSLAAPTVPPAAAQSNPRSILSPISEGDREMFADFNRVAADADAYSKIPFASFGESGSNGGAVDSILNVLFGTMTASMADDDEYGAAQEGGGGGAGEDVDTEAHDRGTDNCSVVLAVLW